MRRQLHNSTQQLVATCRSTTGTIKTSTTANKDSRLNIQRGSQPFIPADIEMENNSRARRTSNRRQGQKQSRSRSGLRKVSPAPKARSRAKTRASTMNIQMQESRWSWAWKYPGGATQLSVCTVDSRRTRPYGSSYPTSMQPISSINVSSVASAALLL